MLRSTSVVITTTGASPLTVVSPVSRPTRSRPVLAHQVVVLLVAQRLDRRGVERLAALCQREVHRELADHRLARPGRRRDQNARARPRGRWHASAWKSSSSNGRALGEPRRARSAAAAALARWRRRTARRARTCHQPRHAVRAAPTTPAPVRRAAAPRRERTSAWSGSGPTPLPVGVGRPAAPGRRGSARGAPVRAPHHRARGVVDVGAGEDPREQAEQAGAGSAVRRSTTSSRPSSHRGVRRDPHPAADRPRVRHRHQRAGLLPDLVVQGDPLAVGPEPAPARRARHARTAPCPRGQASVVGARVDGRVEARRQHGRGTTAGASYPGGPVRTASTARAARLQAALEQPDRRGHVVQRAGRRPVRCRCRCRPPRCRAAGRCPRPRSRRGAPCRPRRPRRARPARRPPPGAPGRGPPRRVAGQVTHVVAPRATQRGRAARARGAHRGRGRPWG